MSESGVSTAFLPDLPHDGDMMDTVEASGIPLRDSRNHSLAAELIAGSLPRMDEEEEPTPVKRLDAAFEVVTRENPLDNAPALQVALRVRRLPPGAEGKASLQIVSEKRVRTTTPPTSGEQEERERGRGRKSNKDGVSKRCRAVV